MRGGTLSDRPSQRLLVLWDGVMAKLPDAVSERRFRALDGVGARRRALAQWKTISISRVSLADVAFRRSIPVDLVTFLGERYVPKLRERVESEALPVGAVSAHTEESLDLFVRENSLLVLAVVHPFTNRPFLFGGKGIPVEAGRPWRLW